MRKILLNIFFTCIVCFVMAQQTPQYSQYILNKYGYNPAAAGTSLKSAFDIMIGTRRQWIDINNAPRTNFGYLNYTFIPKRSYRKWHNIGAYVDQESAGIFANNSFYVSYTFHLMLTKKLIASFGVFAGMRQFAMSRSSVDGNDPAVARSVSTPLFVGPDIVPGFRLYNKRFFFDVCIRQITTPAQSTGTLQIGNKSKLPPVLYVSFGTRIYLEHGFELVPSFNLHSTFTYIPSVEGSVMLKYRNNIAIGASLRNNSFIAAIIQVRFLKNAVFGAAFDYSINQMNIAAPNTFEFMLGFTPMETRDKFAKSGNVAKCPALDF